MVVVATSEMFSWGMWDLLSSMRLGVVWFRRLKSVFKVRKIKIQGLIFRMWCSLCDDMATKLV